MTSFPWLAQYPPHIPPSIPVTAYASLPEMFRETFARFGERPAYTMLGCTLSYRQIDEAADAFAAALAQLGVAKGDRVAIMLPNVLQYPICLFAVLRLGAVVVNCNPLYTTTELAHQLNDSGAETLIVVENVAATAAAIVKDTSVKRVIVTRIGDCMPVFKGLLIDLVLRFVKRSIPAWHMAGAISFKSLIKRHSGERPQPVSLGRDDPAFLQYTGGTTGVSKGATLTHGNMIANILQAEAWLAPPPGERNDQADPAQEIILTALPLYHIFALTANAFTFGRLGALNVLAVNGRDISSLIQLMKSFPITVITGVNTLYNALLNHPEFGQIDTRSFRFALGGGMAVQRSVAERWQAATGIPLGQGYGLSETSPAVCITPLNQTTFNGAIGLPIPSTEVAIKDDEGRDLELGQVGELCIRGPQVFAGYWRRPDETAKVMTADGFFRSGDLGYIDEQGYVFIVDRKKDMVLVSGFNVYPNEIEDVVALHPGVSEAAVVGVPDAHSGEAVKLFVVKKSADLTAEELIAHCRKHLTGYKIPRQVEFRDSLPRSNVGKILRRELRNAPSSPPSSS